MDFPKEFISCIYDKESSYSSANEISVLRFTNSESKNKEQKHAFIHGIGVSLVGWRDISDALSEHFHTISVDLIGFGGSESQLLQTILSKVLAGLFLIFFKQLM